MSKICQVVVDVKLKEVSMENMKCVTYGKDSHATECMVQEALVLNNGGYERSKSDFFSEDE